MPRSLLLVALAALSAAPALAQTCSTSWAAAVDGAWTDASKWTAGVPTATSDACITVDGTYTVTVAGFSVNRLTLGTAGNAGVQTLVQTLNMVFAAGGAIEASGRLDWIQGYILSGTLTNRGLLRVVGSNLGVLPSGDVTALFRNEGTVEQVDTAIFTILDGNGTTRIARVENAGLWDSQGSGQIRNAQLVGTFVNEATGVFRKSAVGATGEPTAFRGPLTVENAGTFDVRAGEIRIEVPFDHQAGGVIKGTATFTQGPAFTHTGDTAPGTNATTGILSWTGAWAPDASSSLVVDLDGTTAGSGHDQLAVSAAATLGGTLDLRVADGTFLAVGDAFTILTAPSVTGTFASVVEAIGYDFSVVVGATSVVVTVTRVNAAPVIVSLDGPAEGAVNVPLAFTASATDADAGQTLTYTYDFGDGSPTVSGVDLTAVSHFYEQTDTYTVRVTVDDGDSGTATATTSVAVNTTTAGEDDSASAFSVAVLSSPSARPGLRVTLAEAGTVRADLYDVQGRHVAALAGGDLGAGAHRLEIPTLAPGLYVARVSATGASGVEAGMRRLVVVR